MQSLIDAVFDAAPDCIFVAGEDGRIVMANEACSRTFGYSVAELIGMEVEELLPEGRRAAHREHRNRFRDDPDSKPRRMGEGRRLTGRRKDGEEIHVEVALSRTQVDGLYRVIAIVRDVSDRVKAEDRLRYLSTHDSLTDLYNRTYLEEEKSRLERGRVTPISVIVLDMDGLKQVNDKYGHAAGDNQLRRLATVLRQAFRAEDVVARTGGDEFCVLLPGAEVAARADAVGRLNAELARHNEISGGQPISVSTGAATTLTARALPAALRAADERMYIAKRRGRGRRKSVV